MPYIIKVDKGYAGYNDVYTTSKNRAKLFVFKKDAEMDLSIWHNGIIEKFTCDKEQYVCAYIVVHKCPVSETKIYGPMFSHKDACYIFNNLVYSKVEAFRFNEIRNNQYYKYAKNNFHEEIYIKRTRLENNNG